MTARLAQWSAAMRAGRYEDAWTLAERTLAERDPTRRDDPTVPYHQRWVWDGRGFDGCDVLVRCYHGLGDTIQFARFLPPLVRRAASVVLEVQPRLLDLLGSTAEGVERVAFDPSRPLPPREVDIEITELDFALRATPHAASTPYLSAAPTALPEGTVALCYGAGDWDRSRSLSPTLMAPLCRIAPCVTLMPEPTGLDVLNPEGCPLNMAATAGLVAGAALVVTVDTMIAHLAGAIGKPTWLLLKADPDWRWPLEGERSAWYPSMRLFRQSDAGDWEAVMDEVERELSAQRASVEERA